MAYAMIIPSIIAAPTRAPAGGTLYQAVMDKIYWLDETVTMDELVWLFKRRKAIVNAKERGSFYEVLGAGLLMHGKISSYKDYVSKNLPNRAEFEKQTYESCKKCDGEGKKPIKCKVCAGKGDCPRSTCRNGITPGPVVMGRRLDVKCGGCKGTTKCTKCEGSGSTSVTCHPCRGKGKIRSRDAAKKLYVASLATFQQGLQLKIAQKSLVSAKGESSEGVGFLVMVDKKPYVATNLHVLNGNTSLTFRLTSGKTVACGDILVSAERDLALFEVKDPEKYSFLDVYAPTNEKTKGKSASVFGKGQTGVTALGGKVNNVGPKFIETDVAFVAGYNGGPLLVGTKVAGLATSATWAPPKWNMTGFKFDKVHQFVTRLDNMTSTEMKKLDVRKYQSQLKVMQSVHKDWLEVADKFASGRQHRFTAPQTIVLKKCLSKLDKENGWSLSQAGDEAKLWKRFLGVMVKELGTIRKLTAKEKEDLMWKELEDEGGFEE
jgi:S1-C subfamily serine protease